MLRAFSEVKVRATHCCSQARLGSGLLIAPYRSIFLVVFPDFPTHKAARPVLHFTVTHKVSLIFYMGAIY